MNDPVDRGPDETQTKKPCTRSNDVTNVFVFGALNLCFFRFQFWPNPLHCDYFASAFFSPHFFGKNGLRKTLFFPVTLNARRNENENKMNSTIGDRMEDETNDRGKSMKMVQPAKDAVKRQTFKMRQLSSCLCVCECVQASVLVDV